MKAKRNKKYVPRIPNIPMMRETHDDLALTLRMAIETLIACPDIEAYNEVSLRFITLGRAMGPQPFMEQAKQAMLDIAARFERVGKIGVSASEAASLREVSGDMDRAIAKVPVNRMLFAELRTQQMAANEGVVR